MTRAFLVGAGFTKSLYLNAPLLKDFLDKAAYINKNDFEQMQRIFGDTIFNRSTNIEYIMKEIEKFDQSRRDTYNIWLHKILYDVLERTTNQDQPICSQDLSAMYQLIQRMDEEDFFITLNYDLVLDNLIYSAFNELDYDIQNNTDFKIESSYPLRHDSKPAHTIYHLHGSVGWLQNASAIVLYLVPLRPSITKGKSNILIIPPGKNKTPSTSLFNYIWDRASARLWRSDELIIIGCGLDKNDDMLRKLIEDYRQLKGSEKIKIIYSSNDNSKPPDCEYLGNIKKYPHGFDLTSSPTDPKKNALTFIFDE